MKKRLTRLLLLLTLLLAAPRLASAQIIGPNPSTTTNLSVSTLTTGTVMDVQPTVSPDGRYVTMKMNLSFSHLEGIDTFVVPAPTLSGTGGNIGGVPLGSPAFAPAGFGAPPLAPPLASVRLDQPTVAPGATVIGGQIWRLPPASAKAILAAQSIAPIPGVTFVEKDKKPLLAHVPALNGDGITLARAIKQIATLSNQNLVLGVAAFKKQGVNVNAPLHLDLPAASLKSTLHDLLTAAAPDSAVVITTEDNVVYITTLAQADNAVEIRTYYVEDLVSNAAKWMPKQRDPNTGELKPVDLGPSGSDNIMAMIARYVRPEIWKSNGGKIGDMSQVANRVTITAPQSVHALLDGPRHYNPNKVPMYVNYVAQ